MPSDKVAVPLDGKAEAAAHGLKLGDTHAAKLGKVHAEIAKDESNIRMVRIKLAQETETGWVFCTRKGRRIESGRKSFATARERAGL